MILFFIESSPQHDLHMHSYIIVEVKFEVKSDEVSEPSVRHFSALVLWVG